MSTDKMRSEPADALSAAYYSVYFDGKKAAREQDHSTQPAGWRDIETAPKRSVYQDGMHHYGEHLLVWGDGFDKPRRARWWWREDDPYKNNFISDGRLAVFPSHWQPLPPPPGEAVIKDSLTPPDADLIAHCARYSSPVEALRAWIQEHK